MVEPTRVPINPPVKVETMTSVSDRTCGCSGGGFSRGFDVANMLGIKLGDGLSSLDEISSSKFVELKFSFENTNSRSFSLDCASNVSVSGGDCG